MQFKNGSLLLFRLFGVNVFVHWSWAVVAAIQIWRNTNRPMPEDARHGLGFFGAQYVCLFLIVLIHEFGHALACKSVGGRAERITLWPLGGVAFVDPPPRPGALLWSIAAGPLVNVVLLPLTIIPAIVAGGFLGGASPMASFLGQLAIINGVLLVFNMLPVYPLDGGQILRALAWYVFGRGTSLVIAAGVGIVGAAALAGLALFAGSIWFGILAAFMAFQSYRAIQSGMVMRRMDNAPRHMQARCPSCGENPPIASLWRCACGNTLDAFTADGQCPRCGQQFPTTACPMCGKAAPLAQWYGASRPPVAATPHEHPGAPIGDQGDFFGKP